MLVANMQRGARATLEERGLLTARQTHANGAEWIFWAEEPEANGKDKQIHTSKFGSA